MHLENEPWHGGEIIQFSEKLEHTGVREGISILAFVEEVWLVLGVLT